MDIFHQTKMTTPIRFVSRIIARVPEEFPKKDIIYVFSNYLQKAYIRIWLFVASKINFTSSYVVIVFFFFCILYLNTLFVRLTLCISKIFFFRNTHANTFLEWNWLVTNFLLGKYWTPRTLSTGKVNLLIKPSRGLSWTFSLLFESFSRFPRFGFTFGIIFKLLFNIFYVMHGDQLVESKNIFMHICKIEIGKDFITRCDHNIENNCYSYFKPCRLNLKFRSAVY